MTAESQGVMLLWTAAGLLAAGVSLYLLLLAVASLTYRRRSESGLPTSRLVVMVPAHNESELVGRCISSLLAQDYPADLFRVAVIADNCEDTTAAEAATMGAEVWVRNEPELRGKGHALRWAFERLIDSERFDAAIVVDADSVASPGLLRALETELRAGSDVAQAEYLVLETHSVRSRLLAAAFLLFHRTRFRGRAALGLPCFVVGNGMLFSRRTLLEHPWNAVAGTEDLEYSITLRLAGVRPAFVGGAQVYGPMANTGHRDRVQRLRWEGGRFHIIRTRLPILIRASVSRHVPNPWDAALDLAVPPLGSLVSGVVCGMAIAVAVAALTGSALPLVSWGAALVMLPAYVVVGLWAADASARHYLALVSAPLFVVRKLLVYARLALGYDPREWHPTRRDHSDRPRRFRLVGIPIDAVGASEAVGGIMALAHKGSLSQVSTINLDFLVTSQRDPEVRRVLEANELNVADGFPIVWMGRLLGHGVPCRVTGHDLVGGVVEQAAKQGVGIFLLGGRGGVAADAATRLADRHPGLRVFSYEPPLSSLQSLDDPQITGRINESGAQIVLVALGHPKQDLWIAHNRNRLHAGVAIGVGCCLDVIAGRVGRAPAWMQRCGLEWLFRVLQEPRRLSGRYLGDAFWLCRMVPAVLVQRFMTLT